MTILEQVKHKTNINVENMLIERLCVELDLPKDSIDRYTKKGIQQLEYDILDVLLIILDNTNLYKVPKEMYATVINMIKDYWYLNKHDLSCLTEKERQKKMQENVKVKSISIGDTTTTFEDMKSQININGSVYNTGSIDFAKNILQEKYKEDFYRHRQMRWD